MKVTIRPARSEEESEVAGLWSQCGLVAPYNDPGADFRFARGKPSSDVLVGIDETGSVAGTVLVGNDGHRGWLYCVATRPDVERRGVGRAMVGAAERWLAERDIVKMQLLVRETNPNVSAFYERLGFETVPRVFMQKWIKDAGP